MNDAGHADRHRTGQPGHGERRSACARESVVASGRPPSSSRAWAETPTASKKARQRGGEPAAVQVRRRRRAERHVAQMPGRVGRMQQRDEVAPAARTAARRRPAGRGHAGRWPSRTPHTSSPAPKLMRCWRTSPIPAARHSAGQIGLVGVETLDARAQESARPRTTRGRPAGPAAAARGGCAPATARAAPGPAGTPNSSIPIRPPGLTTRASSRIVAGAVIDVAQQVGEGEARRTRRRRTAAARPRR